MAVSGKGVAYALGGLTLLYSGYANATVGATLRAFLQGKTPAKASTGAPTVGLSSAASSSSSSGSATVPGLGSGSSSLSTSAAANRALGQKMAAAYGWGSGAEWQALDAIVQEESGWSDTAANPSSDARGIAQNINGWSSSYQEGNAAQQIAWLLSYIKGRYKDPIAALEFHNANGYY